MGRYIDADVLKYYGNHIGDEYEDRFHDAQWVYRNQIDEAPSIDIVRCKECYMCDEEMWCSFYDSIMESDDFCSYGEREGE